VDGMKDELISKESRVYEITHKYVDADERCIVKGNISSKDMNDMIFYIQYKYHNIIPESTLTQFDFEIILPKCYGLESVQDAEIDETIDLYLNFEENFYEEKIDYIMNKSAIYEAEGLDHELDEAFKDTINSNPDIFFLSSLKLKK
jgi:hypothetical protein